MAQRWGKAVLRARRVDMDGRQREEFFRLDARGSASSAMQLAVRWQGGENVDGEENGDADGSGSRDETDED